MLWSFRKKPFIDANQFSDHLEAQPLDRIHRIQIRTIQNLYQTPVPVTTESRARTRITNLDISSLLPPLRLVQMAAALLPRHALPTMSSVIGWSFFSGSQAAPRFLNSLAIAIPGLSISIPGLLQDIWGGILKAVPKNKTSHSRKRHRQMAGKALKDVNHLCKCPGCGAVKRTHRLCENCLQGKQRLGMHIWMHSH